MTIRTSISLYRARTPQRLSLDSVVQILKRHCIAVNMKRFDETKEALEASFLVEFRDFDNLKRAREELRKLKDSIKITFLDNKGIY